MSDILIRGHMKFPNGCGVCPLHTATGYCAGLGKFIVDKDEYRCMFTNYRRLKDCPLVELPEHGDLVEADKLKKIAYGRAKEYGCVAFVDAIDITLAPVIVPASEEGNHDEP